MRKKIILIVLLLVLLIGLAAIKYRSGKRTPQIVDKQINLESIYKIPDNVSYRTSENVCKFKPSNNYPSLKFQTLDEKQIKFIAERFKLTTNPVKGRVNGQIISIWNEKNANVNIIPFPAKVEYFNKIPKVTNGRKTESELIELAKKHLNEYVETEYELAKIDYQQKGNLDVFTKTNFENADLIKLTMTLKNLDENIYVLPDFKPITEVILFPDGEISSLSFYLFDSLPGQNKYDLLKCPDEVLKNISSSTILSLSDKSEGVYDNLDPKNIRSVSIQDISLVYLVEPTSENPEYEVKPYFEVLGTVQTTGMFNGSKALIYLNAAKN